jgi:hypothetical protein
MRASSEPPTLFERVRNTPRIGGTRTWVDPPKSAVPLALHRLDHYCSLILLSRGRGEDNPQKCTRRGPYTSALEYETATGPLASPEAFGG